MKKILPLLIALLVVFASIGGATVAASSQIAAATKTVSILDFGADSTGQKDSTAALNAALAALPSDGGAIYFPRGTYIFSSIITFTMPNSNFSLSLVGDGPDVTFLKWAGGGGIYINYLSQYNSVHVEGFSFVTGGGNVGTALYLNQTAASIANPANTALTTISNVTIRGVDGYAANDYWANGIYVNGVSNINFTNLMTVGTSSFEGCGVYLKGSSAVIPVVFNFTGCTFNYCSKGIIYGNYVEGVTVSQCNFLATCGISAPANLLNLDQLAVIGSQFNCTSAGIVLNTCVPNTLIQNNLFIIPASAVGIQLNSSGLFSIVGNAFNQGNNPSANNGIVVAGSVFPGIITGNAIEGMLGSGIWLKSTSNNVNVQSNVYSGNKTNVTNSGTSNKVGGGSS